MFILIPKPSKPIIPREEKLPFVPLDRDIDEQIVGLGRKYAHIAQFAKESVVESEKNLD